MRSPQSRAWAICFWSWPVLFLVVPLLVSGQTSGQPAGAPGISDKWKSFVTTDLQPLLKTQAPTKENLRHDAQLQAFLALLSQTCERLLENPGPPVEVRISLLQEMTAVRNRLAAQPMNSNKNFRLCNWITQLRRVLVLDLAAEETLTPEQRVTILSATAKVVFLDMDRLRNGLRSRPEHESLPATTNAYSLVLELLRSKEPDAAAIRSFREGMSRVQSKGTPPSLAEQLLGDDPADLAFDLQSILLNDAHTALEANILLSSSYKNAEDSEAKLSSAFRGLTDVHIQALLDTPDPTSDARSKVLRQQERASKTGPEAEHLRNYSISFLKRTLDEAQAQ